MQPGLKIQHKVTEDTNQQWYFEDLIIPWYRFCQLPIILLILSEYFERMARVISANAHVILDIEPKFWDAWNLLCLLQMPMHRSLGWSTENICRWEFEEPTILELNHKPAKCRVWGVAIWTSCGWPVLLMRQWPMWEQWYMNVGTAYYCPYCSWIVCAECRVAEFPAACVCT